MPTAKQAPTTKAAAKKSAATKAAAKQAPAKQAAGNKAPAKKGPAKRAAGKQAPAKKAAASASAFGLLLTPGAGADRSHHTLVAVEDACRASGRVRASVRVDFPYRIAGKRAPDKAPVAVAHLLTAAASLMDAATLDHDRLVLGGRSYGGRMCSLAVAEGLPAAGLVMLSYPLHPPGKPDNLRVDHFPQLRVPVLFVSGDKDPFGSPAELEHHARAIAGPVTHVWLAGGHDPRNQDPAIAAAVVDWLAAL